MNWFKHCFLCNKTPVLDRGNLNLMVYILYFFSHNCKSRINELLFTSVRLCSFSFLHSDRWYFHSIMVKWISFKNMSSAVLHICVPLCPVFILQQFNKCKNNNSYLQLAWLTCGLQHSYRWRDMETAEKKLDEAVGEEESLSPLPQLTLVVVLKVAWGKILFLKSPNPFYQH